MCKPAEPELPLKEDYCGYDPVDIVTDSRTGLSFVIIEPLMTSQSSIQTETPFPSSNHGLFISDAAFNTEDRMVVKTRIGQLTQEDT